jgi:hypothetical protein
MKRSGSDAGNYDTEQFLCVLVAGPPCPPWSKRGKRQGTNDPRARTHVALQTYVTTNKFDVLVYECVWADELVDLLGIWYPKPQYEVPPP